MLGRCCCDAVKRVALAFESLSTGGARINLAVGAFYGGLGCVCSVAVGQPIGPLWAHLTWLFVTTHIKAMGGSR
jgi:hypothetical protein